MENCKRTIWESSKPPTTLKGGCREKRLENCFSHFKNLLGKPETLPEDKTFPKLQVCNSLTFQQENSP